MRFNEFLKFVEIRSVRVLKVVDFVAKAIRIDEYIINSHDVGRVAVRARNSSDENQRSRVGIRVDEFFQFHLLLFRQMLAWGAGMRMLPLSLEKNPPFEHGEAMDDCTGNVFDRFVA